VGYHLEKVRKKRGTTDNTGVGEGYKGDRRNSLEGDGRGTVRKQGAGEEFCSEKEGSEHDRGSTEILWRLDCLGQGIC